jgi:hypothetical protein
VLARRSILRLPSGQALDTPLLVPSISSKGFSIDDAGVSAVADPLAFAAPLIQDAMLISAYDLGHGLLPGAADLSVFPAKGPMSNPACVLVDSGQYEVAPAYDLSETYEFPYEPQAWNEEMLVVAISRLSPQLSAIIVNLDRHGPVDNQIASARTFFDRFPTFLHDFLIKPEKAGQFLAPDRLAAVVPQLAPFHLVGVTEKELGNTLLNRLVAIARLRMALDRADMKNKPIHVFGSLDPILSPLYFLAGAEVFDGLSWLRYAYHDGVAVYGESLAVLRGELSHHRNQRRATMITNNLSYLQDLEIRMRRFLLDANGDFSVFGAHAEKLREGYGALRTVVTEVA